MPPRQSMLVAATLAVLRVMPVLGGGACAGIDHVNHVDGSAPTGTDAPSILLDARLSDRPRCTEAGVMRINPRPADVLVLLDRSSSMDMAFGSGSRYQAVSAVLADLVTAYQSHVRFGYMEMPGRDGCEFQAANCCASAPRVELALGNAPAMTSALAAAAPLGGGSTPMAQALLAASLYYGPPGDQGSNRYVVMATDGVPGCTLGGILSNGSTSASPACVDAKTQVDGLVSIGVKVIVLSLGPNPATSPDDDGCLEVLAQAGRAPRANGGPGYYSAAEPDDLSMTLEQIFGVLSIPSCVLSVPPGDDKSLVGVFLDGQEIPSSTADGWTWMDPSSWDIEITGAYCKQIQQFQVSRFEARYGCPVSCIDRGGCPSGTGGSGPPPS